jgi:serine phosphatase RsbU (regulator of sigma subunit)
MRKASTPRLLGLALLLSAGGGIALGQEPAPARLTSAAVAEFGIIELTRAWRFHSGDDPGWASPTLDDSGWELVEPTMPSDRLPRSGWPGIGWFRRHLRVESAFSRVPLALRLVGAGAAEVYLDGELLFRSGNVGANANRETQGSNPGPWTVTPSSASPEHVLAVRYSCASAPAFLGYRMPIGFVLSLGPADTVIPQLHGQLRRNSLLEATFITVPLFLALLHLALFSFYPTARENLFYAFCMAAFAGIVYTDFQRAFTTSLGTELLLRRLSNPSIIAVIFFALLTYYAVRTRPFPRSWIVFATVGAGLVLANFFSPATFSPWSWYAYFVLMVAEIVRVEARGRTVERAGAGVLLAGMAVLLAVIVLQLLINLGLVGPIAGVSAVYVFGMLAFAVGMSLFLARTLARTSLHLERRLVEVQALSGQLLEQERTAHANELQARLVAAENERKSRELEEGRALQLSMLPPALPEIDGLEVAVAMTTASEVGGDYYDFRVSSDGSLVVAVGDATGHGVAAGIMVTAVKAVLATVGGEPSLSTMLAECDRVLRGMNVKHLHMCLTVARVTPRSATVGSAAMPPVLVWRADTGKVEELGAGGLPLGGRLSPAYEEVSAPLAPGDTLLLATDGFAELLDPAGSSLGFDGAAEALRGAAGVAARDVVERLAAAAAAWRRERELADDITFVVIRVRP